MQTTCRSVDFLGDSLLLDDDTDGRSRNQAASPGHPGETVRKQRATVTALDECNKWQHVSDRVGNRAREIERVGM